MITRAIVRPPGATFASGLTTAGLGPPDLELAREQHQRYCEALRSCGVTLTRLAADPRHPDSTFVEDTAVLTPGAAILARPGAAARRAEVPLIQGALERFYGSFHQVTPPGTLDGGDVCQAGRLFFIGLSWRTNEEGARQLAGFLGVEGFEATMVDVRDTPGLLHLKSGMAWLGEGRLLVLDALAERSAFHGFDLVRVCAGEEYGANCVRVNDRILVAAGHPNLESALRDLGCRTITLEMSEFRKMDGGLSCLSLRF